MLVAFLPNWLEVTILLSAWAILIVDVMRQRLMSGWAKVAWIVFLILVPVLSWIAWGIWRLISRRSAERA